MGISYGDDMSTMSTPLGIAELSAAGQLVVALHDPRLNAIPASVLRSPARAYGHLANYGEVAYSRMFVPGAPILFTVTVRMSLREEPVRADGLSFHAAALRAMIVCEGEVRALIAGL